MFIEVVAKALEEAKVPFAIVGGFAVALYGFPRGTLDVDLVIQWSKEHLELAEKALKKIGLVSRLPLDSQSVFNFRDEYIQNRNLIAWNFYNPLNPAEQVDLIITYNLKPSEIVTRKSLPVLSKKSLIAMKKASGRPQDLEDLKFLEGK
ncbi:MAG: hypothetical protein KDK62_05680 [Chlamydiia bacterium]|nr:hypothetical protein [Chlamydiia bacterium]